MAKIQKLKLQNFKRFKTFSVEFASDINIFIGDNESGKSSILTAIHLILSGSTTKVDALGLESLFNAEVVDAFLKGKKRYEELPELYVEVYLDEQNNPDLNGKNNLEHRECDGLRLSCVPNDAFTKEIKDVLAQPDCLFPFEYYAIRFTTFQGDGYTGYRRFVKHVLLDNSMVSADYAVKEYIRSMYLAKASAVEKNHHQIEYRRAKETFTSTVLFDINSRLVGEYTFGVKHNSKSNIETDLTLSHGQIDIDNKGKGQQCFIKTEFALSKSEPNLDVILIEEPENHLSHLNMKKLIDEIRKGAVDKQVFITTHSNMISARLDLRNCIMLNSSSERSAKLSALSHETAKFFMKAPDNSILDFVLSKKVILVEGDAEYMLVDTFFKKITGQSSELSGVQIISVDGTSFKRYLDVASLLDIKTAVIRDNDGDFSVNCVERYIGYVSATRKVFAETNDTRSTFEICIYEDNRLLCDTFFAGRKPSVREYMLNNKAEVAFQIMEQKSNEVVAPEYIKDAIEWISK